MFVGTEGILKQAGQKANLPQQRLKAVLAVQPLTGMNESKVAIADLSLGSSELVFDPTERDGFFYSVSPTPQTTEHTLNAPLPRHVTSDDPVRSRIIFVSLQGVLRHTTSTVTIFRCHEP